MTVATHSPYILTAINIMLLAKRAYEKDAAACNAVCNDCPTLDLNEIGAWSVKDGQCESLINEELGMIDGTFLDSTSDIYEDIILNLNNIIYG